LGGSSWRARVEKREESLLISSSRYDIIEEVVMVECQGLRYSHILEFNLNLLKIMETPPIRVSWRRIFPDRDDL